MARIYTRAGDLGRTGLSDGTRLPKSDARVAAYGDVDELNACLGLARSGLGDGPLGDLDALLGDVQRDLFALGAVLADPGRSGEEPAGASDRGGAFGPDRVAELESAIDRWEEELPPLRRFVLPGGTASAAALHVARTVARRAERAVVGLSDGGDDVHPALLVYLNRLSDLLFVAARLANARSGREDVLW